MPRVVIIGPAHPLRGGLATFNQRLAKAFIDEGYTCAIFSFSLQYPSFLFPGKTQYTDEPPPEGIDIYPIINSVNPLNWITVGNKLKKMKPDIVVVRFWLPFMGPALGTILRKARKNKHTRIICIADNIIPHEKRPGDRSFTKYFLKAPHAFITMSDKVMTDLRSFEKNKPASVVTHPLYDNFGEPIPKEEARKHLGQPANEKIILFFGFIRNYKGLDILYKAMATPAIRAAGIKLMVAGEYYEDEKKYEELVKELDISGQLILKTDFIPDSQVKYFLCAADVVIQPYRNATQSGVTPLAYHFEKPMIVTNVGGLPLLVPDGKVGLVVEPDPNAIAEGILRFYEKGEETFIQNIKEEKKKYTWTRLVDNIIKLSIFRP